MRRHVGMADCRISDGAERNGPLKGVWPQVGGDQRESKATVHSRGATTAAADSRPDRGLITPIIDPGRVTVGGCVLGVRAPTADDNDTCANADFRAVGWAQGGQLIS